jgi:transketolase
MALENTNGPTAIVLSRQKVHPIPGAENIEYETVARGGYIAYRKNSVMQPEIVICATGSEVALAYEVALALEEKGIEVTVVSMPCAELFLSQDEGYRDAVIPKTALRVVIEAGVKFGWERILGDNGLFYGVESYGISAPAEEIFRYFGLNKHNIATDIANKHGMTLTI